MPEDEAILSVFVDESGTFRHPDPSSRYYIVSLVLHEQSSDISRFVCELDAATERMGLDPKAFASHAGPLIRKEKMFASPRHLAVWARVPRARSRARRATLLPTPASHFVCFVYFVVPNSLTPPLLHSLALPPHI